MLKDKIKNKIKHTKQNKSNYKLKKSFNLPMSTR
jgi:hypothetical protein